MRRTLSALAIASAVVFPTLLAPAAAWAIDARFLNGAWSGTYTCNGQETYMRLDLEGDRNGNVSGTFQFAPVDGATGPYGAFNIDGEINEKWFMELRGGSWIDRPDGYRTVDLRGVVQTGGIFSGQVMDAACTTFYIRRK